MVVRCTYKGEKVQGVYENVQWCTVGRYFIELLFFMCLMQFNVWLEGCGRRRDVSCNPSHAPNSCSNDHGPRFLQKHLGFDENVTWASADIAFSRWVSFLTAAMQESDGIRWRSWNPPTTSGDLAHSRCVSFLTAAMEASDSRKKTNSVGYWGRSDSGGVEHRHVPPMHIVAVKPGCRRFVCLTSSCCSKNVCKRCNRSWFRSFFQSMPLSWM